MNTFSSQEVIERLKNALSISTDTELANVLGVTKATVSNWRSRNSFDVRLLHAKCSHLNLDWVLTGRGSASIKSDVTNSVSVPYFETDFIGGYDELFNDQSFLPTCYISVPGFERADCWCSIRGNSMSPLISNGDLIALKECTLENIKYGEVYAVVMEDLRTIKKIRRSFSDENLRFIPINPDYDEQEYHKSRIIRVFEVLGSITKFF